MAVLINILTDPHTLLRCLLWNSCIRIFASPLSVILSFTSVFNPPHCSTKSLTAIFKRPYARHLFWGCLRLPPGKHLLGSSVGIALFDLCYLDYNGAAEEDPVSLIPFTHWQQTPPVSPCGPVSGLLRTATCFTAALFQRFQPQWFNVSNPIGALRYLWPQLKPCSSSPGSVHWQPVLVSVLFGISAMKNPCFFGRAAGFCLVMGLSPVKWSSVWQKATFPWKEKTTFDFSVVLFFSFRTCSLTLE